MTIPKETLKKWGELREKGDFIVLAKKTGLKRTQLHYIFTTGECLTAKAAIINKFYLEKESVQNSLKTHKDAD